MYFQGFFLFLMLKRKDLLVKGITTKAAAPAWLGFNRCLDCASVPRACVCVTYACVHTCARVCSAGVVQGL